MPLVNILATEVKRRIGNNVNVCLSLSLSLALARKKKYFEVTLRGPGTLNVMVKSHFQQLVRTTIPP